MPVHSCLFRKKGVRRHEKYSDYLGLTLRPNSFLRMSSASAFRFFLWLAVSNFKLLAVCGVPFMYARIASRSQVSLCRWPSPIGSGNRFFPSLASRKRRRTVGIEIPKINATSLIRSADTRSSVRIDCFFQFCVRLSPEILRRLRHPSFNNKFDTHLSPKQQYEYYP